MLRIPAGVGILFSAEARKRLKLSLLGSVMVALLDLAGVVAMVPLLQLLSGYERDTGALGAIVGVLGDEASDQQVVLVLGSLIVCAFLAKAVATIIFRRWQLGFVAEEEGRTASRLLEGYLNAPYALHLRRNSSDLLRMLGEGTSQTYSATVSGALGLLADVVTAVILASVLLVAAPLPALLAITFFSASGLLLQRFVKPRIAASGAQMVEYSAEALRTSIEAFGGVKEIKLRGSAAEYADRYSIARRELANARKTQGIMMEFPRYAIELVFVLGVALVATLAYSVYSPARATSTLGLFVVVGIRLMPTVSRMLSNATLIRYGRGGMEMVVGEFHALKDMETHAVASGGSLGQGDILLEDVGFSYDDAHEQVIAGASLRVPWGTTTALVGPSGAGKSTLVDLVLGLHSPSSGRITVNGVDIVTHLRGWQDQLAVVPQDVFLLDDTLRANIAFSVSKQVDETRVAEAVERAELSQLVADLPDGLDTYVGERGVRISGGQKQRIGIARALYRRPSVLVMDEATSALDNDTERRFTRTIKTLHGSMTIIVVAHRLSTVKDCDQLVFMARGAIQNVGTFEEVRATNSEFARLVELGSLDAPPLRG